MTFITLNDLINDLGVFEFEIRTSTPSGENNTFAVGDTLTCDSETMVVTRVISATRYAVRTVSGAMTLGSAISSDGSSDTAVLLLSDAVAYQTFINRAEGLFEDHTNTNPLNTGTSATVTFTTTEQDSTFLIPDEYRPVISIDSITLNGSTYTGTVGVTNDYTVDYTSGIIDFHSGATLSDGKKNNLVITLTYGDASATVAGLSQNILMMIVEIVQWLYAKWYAVVVGAGASSVNPGSFAMSFSDTELLTEDRKERLQTKTKWLLS